MKKIKIIILFLVAITNLIAQNDLLNHKKYWYYRHRLLNDFMVKGDCQGCSEIINEREQKDVSDPSPIDQKRAKWGDQLFNLGEYISVLATEFKMLQDNNQPTDTTIQELYFAIRAFNRLDYYAEKYLAIAKGLSHTQSDSDLNGFFIRDDVPVNFLLQHPKLSQGVTSLKTVTIVDSDFQDAMSLSPNYNNKTFAMSHDQVWPIFMGLALVRKFLYPGINYQNLPLNEVDGNSDIWIEASNITTRIMNSFHHPNLLQNWTIVNPLENNHSNIQGYQIGELSFGVAEAACFIKNMNTNINPGLVIHTCDEYHDSYSFTNAPAWNNFGKGVGNLLAFNYEDFKIQLLAAIGNSWWLYNPLPFFPFPPVNTTSAELGTRAILRDNQHLPLLRQVLHSGSNPITQGTYQSLLNSAPCEGPRCFLASSGPCSTFEWSSRDRLHTSDERGGGSNQGEYAGLDYMLYYNLYNIINPSTIPYVNYMDSRITFPIPIGNPLLGTTTNPLTIEAFNTIEASNVVNSNADATYRAGKSIHFGPDFHVVAGANFHAYIDPFECASDGEYRSASPSNDNYNNAVAYAGNTTFINYPAKPQENQYLNNTSPSNTNIIEEFKKISENFKISPNPCQGVFIIENTLTKSSNFEITIYDILGNIIMESLMTENKLEINLENYSKGVYHVQISNMNGFRETKKMIVQ